MTFKSFAAALLAALLIQPISTLTALAGDLSIKHPTLRATAPGAKVGAGYAIISNAGQTDDRLIEVRAKFAKRVELHEMKMQDQVMKMSPLANGVAAPAGQTVKLVPGGNHIMFMGLEGPLKAGETRKATLVFEKAGPMELTFTVKPIGETLKMKHSH